MGNEMKITCLGDELCQEKAHAVGLKSITSLHKDE